MARTGRSLLAATVVEVGEGPYVYPACKQCYSKLMVTLHSKEPSRCVRCGTRHWQDDVEYRYRLSMNVADSSSMAAVTSFGGMLNRFFGVTASVFQQKYLSPLRERYGDAAQHILKIVMDQTFVGQNLIFGVKIPLITTKQTLASALSSGQEAANIKDLTSRAATSSINTSDFGSQLIAVQLVPQTDSMVSVTVVQNLTNLLAGIDKLNLTPHDCINKLALMQLGQLLSRGNSESTFTEAKSVVERRRSRQYSLGSQDSVCSSLEQTSMALSCQSSLNELHVSVSGGGYLSLCGSQNEDVVDNFSNISRVSNGQRTELAEIDQNRETPIVDSGEMRKLKTTESFGINHVAKFKRRKKRKLQSCPSVCDVDVKQLRCDTMSHDENLDFTPSRSMPCCTAAGGKIKSVHKLTLQGLAHSDKSQQSRLLSEHCENYGHILSQTVEDTEPLVQKTSSGSQPASWSVRKYWKQKEKQTDGPHTAFDTLWEAELLKNYPKYLQLKDKRMSEDLSPAVEKKASLYFNHLSAQRLLANKHVQDNFLHKVKTNFRSSQNILMGRQEQCHYSQVTKAHGNLSSTKDGLSAQPSHKLLSTCIDSHLNLATHLAGDHHTFIDMPESEGLDIFLTEAGCHGDETCDDMLSVQGAKQKICSDTNNCVVVTSVAEAIDKGVLTLNKNPADERSTPVKACDDDGLVAEGNLQHSQFSSSSGTQAEELMSKMLGTQSVFDDSFQMTEEFAHNISANVTLRRHQKSWKSFCNMSGSHNQGSQPVCHALGNVDPSNKRVEPLSSDLDLQDFPESEDLWKFLDDLPENKLSSANNMSTTVVGDVTRAGLDQTHAGDDGPLSAFKASLQTSAKHKYAQLSNSDQQHQSGLVSERVVNLPIHDRERKLTDSHVTEDADSDVSNDESLSVEKSPEDTVIINNKDVSSSCLQGQCSLENIGQSFDCDNHVCCRKPSREIVDCMTESGSRVKSFPPTARLGKMTESEMLHVGCEISHTPRAFPLSHAPTHDQTAAENSSDLSRSLSDKLSRGLEGVKKVSYQSHCDVVSSPSASPGQNSLSVSFSSSQDLFSSQQSDSSPPVYVSQTESASSIKDKVLSVPHTTSPNERRNSTCNSCSLNDETVAVGDTRLSYSETDLVSHQWPQSKNCQTESLNQSQTFNWTESFGDELPIFSKKTTGHKFTKKKVRFSGRRHEHQFYDFEIISHIPVMRSDVTPLKPCLKRDAISIDAVNSPDLFSDLSSVADKTVSPHSAQLYGPQDESINTSAELFSQPSLFSPLPEGPACEPTHPTTSGTSGIYEDRSLVKKNKLLYQCHTGVGYDNEEKTTLGKNYKPCLTSSRCRHNSHLCQQQDEESNLSIDLFTPSQSPIFSAITQPVVSLYKRADVRASADAVASPILTSATAASQSHSPPLTPACAHLAFNSSCVTPELF